MYVRFALISLRIIQATGRCGRSDALHPLYERSGNANGAQTRRRRKKRFRVHSDIANCTQRLQDDRRVQLTQHAIAIETDITNKPGMHREARKLFMAHTLLERPVSCTTATIQVNDAPSVSMCPLALVANFRLSATHACTGVSGCRSEHRSARELDVFALPRTISPRLLFRPCRCQSLSSVIVHNSSSRSRRLPFPVYSLSA